MTKVAERIRAVSIKYFAYPPEALAKELEGTVVLEFTINEYGEIRQVKILESSGHKSLDEAALRHGAKIEAALRQNPLIRKGACFTGEVVFAQPVEFLLSPWENIDMSGLETLQEAADSQKF